MSSLALVCQTLSCCFNIWNLHKKVHSLHILSWCKMWTFPDVTWHRKTTETLGLLWAQTPLWALENGDLNPISNFCSLTFRRRVSRLWLRWRVRAMLWGNWLLKCTFLKRHILLQIEVFFFRWSYCLLIMSFQWTLVFFCIKARQKMGVSLLMSQQLYSCGYISKTANWDLSICAANINITSSAPIRASPSHILANFDTAFPKTCGVCICGSHRRLLMMTPVFKLIFHFRGVHFHHCPV